MQQHDTHSIRISNKRSNEHIMTHTITIERSFSTAVTPSPNVLQTSSMFGMGLDAARKLAVVPPTQVPLPQKGIVFITGPSGGGKSTILRLIARQARHEPSIPRRVIDFDELAIDALPDRPLVDVFDLPLEQATSLLARAGLGDAFVMLRRSQQLSDGQRYRLRLAMAMREAQQHDEREGDGPIIIADEFGATLDRTTAKVIARNIRRWTRRANCTFIAATTHDDLLEAFEPDVLIVKGLGEAIEVVQR
jgi:uncharacterized protein